MTPRMCIEELVNYVETKYADLLDIDEDIPFSPKKVQKLMDKLEEGMSIGKLIKASGKLNKCERKALCDEIRLFAANSIGNLIETFRYESIDEGELYEQYLDSLLKFAESLVDKKLTTYTQFQYQYAMQVCER